MITTLTESQKLLINQIRDEWLQLSQTQKNITISDVEKEVETLYALDGRKKPLILILNDPLQCQYLANILSSKKGSQIRSQIHSQIYSHIHSHIHSQIYSQIDSQIRSQIDLQIDSQIDSQIRSQIDLQIDLQIYSHIHSQIDSHIHSQIRSQIDLQIHSQIDLQIRSQIRSQIDSHIHSQIDSQIRSQIDSHIRSQIYSQIRSQIDLQKLTYNSTIGGLSWRSGYMAEFDYYIQSGLLDINSKLKEKTNQHIEFLKKGVWDLLVFENVCIISKCPKTKRDNAQRLHSLNSKAVEFPSGYGFYSIHGVLFNEKLWKKVSKRKLSAKEIILLENIEQRFAAIRHYGMENIFSELDHTLIDKSVRGNELYSINGINPEKSVLYLKYNDTAPTDRVFIKGVPDTDDLGNPIKLADAAQAWSHHMTLQEYNKLVVES